MNLLSLQLGRPRGGVSQLKDGNTAEWVSSIWRTPTTDRLHLGRMDLAGNLQADLKNHGGPDKAVCCYSAEHYPSWRDFLSLTAEEFGHGALGENFTVTEMTEDAVCLGDTYTLGTATVQVSQPRMPCWKVGRRWEHPSLPGEMTQSGRTGFYLRVLTEGEVGAGDTLTLQERPLPEWTLTRLNDALYVHKSDIKLAQEVSRLPLLAEAWRRTFRRRAGLLRYRENLKETKQ